MIIDVHCEDDSTQIARIVQDSETTYSVQFLERNKYRMYNFMDTVEVIAKDSVSGFYDTDDLEKTCMYTKNVNGYERVDDSEDEDYSASESGNEESESDVSLVDESENEA
tara:strand:- start:952 stop:1281 length:330 start_codon:yes stop_codon:yes gene_type:complete